MKRLPGANTSATEKPSPSHTYRIELPNLIDEMGLSPFEIALYVHIKRRAGDKGVCNENCRELAEATRMSGGQVSKAKNSLKRMGLIDVQTVKGRDVITISDIWEKNLKHFAPHLVECSPGEQTDHGVNKLITVRSNCSPSEQTDHLVNIPPHPPIRIQEPLQEPSSRTTQELSLSPQASRAPDGAGDEPEREREVEPRWKTKYTLAQVQACARSKGLGDGWITEALYTGKHDWQVEQHLNPPLPMPPTPVLLNPKECPDCEGRNFYYPVGPAGGVAKCPHDRLLVKLKARAKGEANEARGSPEAAAG